MSKYLRLLLRDTPDLAESLVENLPRIDELLSPKLLAARDKNIKAAKCISCQTKLDEPKTVSEKPQASVDGSESYIEVVKHSSEERSDVHRKRNAVPATSLSAQLAKKKLKLNPNFCIPTRIVGASTEKPRVPSQPSSTKPKSSHHVHKSKPYQAILQHPVKSVIKPIPQQPTLRAPSKSVSFHQPNNFDIMPVLTPKPGQQVSHTNTAHTKTVNSPYFTDSIFSSAPQHQYARTAVNEFDSATFDFNGSRSLSIPDGSDEAMKLEIASHFQNR